MNTPRPQTQPPQMESNPLQRALDNYLVMEMERDAARHEAAEVRTQNAGLLAEVNILREHLENVDADRRKWEAAATTLLGRLLSINDTISGAVRQATRDGMQALNTKDEPFAVDGGVAAPPQEPKQEESPKAPAETKAAPEPSQQLPASVPMNEWRQ